jgi:polyvinyl alcohol dehydrogenase (cytochrome)
LEIAERAVAALIVVSLAGCEGPPDTGPQARHPRIVAEAWDMYRGDLARDGHPFDAVLDVASAARLTPAWRVRLDGAIDGTPVVAQGMVIAATAAGTVDAVDARTGRTVWVEDNLGAIASSPTVSGVAVYVGTLTGSVYAFDVATGNTLWRWNGPPSSALWASPVSYMNELIIGAASPYGDNPLTAGRLFGLDAATGRERWSMCLLPGCAPGDGVWSTPAIDRNGVAFVGVGNPDDAVLAFDPQTGKGKWLTSLYPDQGRDLDVGATPVVFSLNGKEVVGEAAVEGKFALLDAADGSVVWSRELVAGSAVHGLIASPAYDGIHLYVGSASPPTAMFALQPADGSVIWRYDVGVPIYSAPAVGKGVLVYGTGAVLGDLSIGEIIAQSAADGRVLWKYDTHAAVRSGPALAGDLVVVGDQVGDLFAFQPKR